MARRSDGLGTFMEKPMVRVRDWDLEEEGEVDDGLRGRRFDSSRRRTKGKWSDGVHPPALVRTKLDPFSLAVKRRRYFGALRQIGDGLVTLTERHTAPIQSLLVGIIEEGLAITEELYAEALTCLRACATWFRRTADPKAHAVICHHLTESERDACPLCQLLRELFSPEVAPAT